MTSNLMTNQQDNTGAVLCGCGEAFAGCSTFREHSLLDHEGEYIMGSTHYLTKFTLIVLPVKKVQRDKRPQKTIILTNTEETNNADNIHTKKGRKRSGLSLETYHEKQEERTQPIPDSHNWKLFETCELQDIRLIRVNKNRILYCGNCQRSKFKDLKQFIIHCRDICKGDHQMSSHRLYFLDYASTTGKKELNTHHYYCTKKTMGISQDDRDVPFECRYCLQVFFQGNIYYRHCLRMHSEVIDSNMSHIILRIRRPSDFNRVEYTYFTDRVQVVNQDKTYFCPCKPAKKTSLGNLIKHIREVHMGISPYYH